MALTGDGGGRPQPDGGQEPGLGEDAGRVQGTRISLAHIHTHTHTHTDTHIHLHTHIRTQDIFDVKKVQFTSVLKASNLDPVVLQNVTKKLDDVLTSKVQPLHILRVPACCPLPQPRTCVHVCLTLQTRNGTN
jgi:hypothetical protein